MRVLRHPTSGRVKRGSAGAILRAVAGEADQCPCCGGGFEGCACPNDTSILLPDCCCLPDTDPNYCGDNDALCADICETEGGGDCRCGSTGTTLPDCCCMPLSSGVSCADYTALCVDPCAQGPCPSGCPCCGTCDMQTGVWSVTFTHNSTFYANGPLKNPDTANISVTGTRLITKPGSTCQGSAIQCVMSGTYTQYKPDNTILRQWNGTKAYTGATGVPADCSVSAIFGAGDSQWVVGTGQNFQIRSSDCQTWDRNCYRGYGEGQSGGPPNTCFSVTSCTLPECAGNPLGLLGMGACASAAYGIVDVGGVRMLTILPYFEHAAGVRPAVCPVCSRDGWDGVWRAMVDAPGALRSHGGASMQARTKRTQVEAHRRAERRARGLGDSVERGIKWITAGRVKACGGCRKRQEWLNRIVPYGNGRHRAPGTGQQ